MMYLAATKRHPLPRKSLIGCQLRRWHNSRGWNGEPNSDLGKSPSYRTMCAGMTRRRTEQTPYITYRFWHKWASQAGAHTREGARGWWREPDPSAPRAGVAP